MEKIVIHGGRKLNGKVKISGSKNASLPILIATLLTNQRCSIDNVPHLEDVSTILALIRLLGKRILFRGHKVQITRAKKLGQEAPYELVKKMRASILVMGPILARRGRVKVSLPGGCAIGLRPIDIHLEGFKRMGAKVKISRGYVEVYADTLRGTDIWFDCR